MCLGLPWLASGSSQPQVMHMSDLLHYDRSLNYGVVVGLVREVGVAASVCSGVSSGVSADVASGGGTGLRPGVLVGSSPSPSPPPPVTVTSASSTAGGSSGVWSFLTSCTANVWSPGSTSSRVKASVA